MKKTIWDYRPEEVIGLFREHVDAVLVADAETDEYRAFFRKGVFTDLISERGTYSELIEALWFHLSESQEKITENYHVFVPSYGKFTGKVSKRLRLTVDGQDTPVIAQMTVYPVAESQYLFLLDEMDNSEYLQESATSKKVDTIQSSFLFSMFFDLGRNTTSSLSVTEISDDTVHAEISYSDWRHMIVNMFGPDDQALFLERTDPEYLKKNFTPGKTSSYDCMMMNLEGKFIWVKLIFSRVETTNEDDYRFVFMVQNIHENLMELFGELKKYEQLALTDSMTGLFNHGRMETEISNAIESIKKQEERSFLLFTDIDFFKNINDRYGHAAGDRALRTFAEVITGQISGKKAVAGRWGGEEFLIVCYGEDPGEIRALAENLRAQVEKTDFPEVGHFTCSVGMTALRADDTVKDAFERVDRALYQAKNAGRNRIMAADEGL